MNQRQKTVLKAQLESEEKIIHELKQVYKQAAKDCENKIKELSARRDMENLQSIIYQKQYQEALKKQLEGIIDNLQSKQFDSIAGYLTGCYEEGFLGTLYDLQGQGVPLIFPINQKQVVAALQTDSKLSEGLYKRLGEDSAQLKKSIRAELSRGVANGGTWNEIAVHIATGMNSPFKKAMNNSMRIARTEGHRVQCQSALDCQRNAKDKGADIVKQWDSTMDKRTRKTHVKLDGQIRELDKPFEVDGRRAMYPGGFGIAKEDIHCRCAILQRARWALTDEEFTKMNGDTGELVSIHEKDYNIFKKKAKEIINKQQESSVQLGEIGTAYGRKHSKAIIKYIQDAPEQVRKVWNGCANDFHVLESKYRGQQAFYSPSKDGVKLNIVAAAKGSDYQTPYQVVFHEYGHHTDYILNRKYGNGDRKKAFSETYKNGVFGETLKKEADKSVKDFAKSQINVKDVEQNVDSMVKRGLIKESERKRYIENAINNPIISDDVYKAFCKHMKEELSLIQRSDISDMFEPVMPRSCAYPFGVGHGSSYWLLRDNGKEGFAEMFSAMVNNPESMEQIKHYFPQSYKIFLEMLEVVK